MKYVISVFLAFAATLYSAQPLSKQAPCVIAEEAPCSFVNDTVNVVEGNFCLEMPHISVPGHVPLDLVQYYNNQSRYSSWLGVGMSLNYAFSMQGSSMSYKRHDKYNEYGLMLAEMPGGSIITCLGRSIVDGTSNYYLDPDVIYKSLSNCGSGKISARTNLKNIRVKEKAHKNSHADWTCYLPDGSMRKYYRSYNKDDAMNVRSEKRLNNTGLEFFYHKHKQEGTIKRIEAKAADTMNWLAFPAPKHHVAEVTSSNGKAAKFYYFDHDDDYYIHKIETSDNPTQKFFYKTAGEYYCINKVEWPEGRFLEIEYDRKGKVTAQKAPVGKHGETRTLYAFDYHDKHTNVTNANGHKKVYHHNDGKITSIDDMQNDTRYRSHAYYWGARKGLSWAKQPKTLEGNLLGYATLNHEGCGLLSCSYSYDEFGNITQETLSGNLSGTYPFAFWVDASAKPKDANVEHYSKCYRYSDNHLLTHQTEDNGPSYEYRYIDGTDLMWAKFVKDNEKIILREFYEYDHNGIVKEKIIDNGTSDNKSDLTGVTQRLITHIWPVANKTGYGQGLAEDVWENYLDLTINAITLLRHTHYSYNQAGQVVEETIYDADNKSCHTTKYEYNHKGKLHAKIDALGVQTEYTYDANNNKQYEKQLNVDAHTNYYYDSANRLTSTIEYHYDNSTVETRFEYDCMGNQTATIDRYGNRTSYEYDSCNRVCKITYPDTSTILKEYDIFDNVVKETNQNGAVTTFEYTIRKEPSCITYADGSVEKFIYNKNGTLAHKYDKSGTQTCYEYDLLGRITKTSVLDAKGDLLFTTSNSYNAFHLLSSTDAMGLTTYYRYDDAGRKVEEWQEDSTNFTKTCYEYDLFSRLIVTKKYYSSTDYIAYIVDYDNLHRIIQERVEDMSGVCLNWSSYTYDALGNCTVKRSGHSEHEDAEYLRRYNSKNECIAETDEVGSTTALQYIHGYSSKTPLQKITTDALNNSTEEYYDILGRVVLVLRKNPTGDITASSDFEYSPTGKKTKQIEHVLIHGQIDHDYIISWEYDLLDRVLRQVEQPNTPDQKVTAYSYDLSGRIATIIKPDATVLQHTYDALSRLVSLASSDNTISYRYSYDLHNNPIKIEDKVSGLTTTRSYDLWSRLTSDGIEDQFSLNYQYDALGRLTNLLAPDTSSVQYSYTARLDAIARYSPSARLEYEHRYTGFDRAGRVIENELIHNLGSCNFGWDKKGRNSSIQTKYFSQSIPTDGFDAVGNLKTYSFSDAIGYETVTCSYDDLYQLTEEKGNQKHIYAHDSLNNRISKNDSEYRVDAHNKITSDGLSAYVYDKNGNLIQDAVNSYSYDALGRLTAVKNAHGTTCYVYDSFNRRIKKNDAFFLYQGMREIGTFKAGKLTEFRVLGIGKGAELGASVAIELNGTVYCPIHDFRGNIVCLVDASQQVTESYRYTAFGECQVQSHHPMPTNPWRFASKRYDPETGFSYFLNRYYSPSLGRWITPDPLGFADGPNIYAYVHNNPMTRFDLYGLYMLEHDQSNAIGGMIIYGIVETIALDLLDLACLGFAGSQTDGFGGSALGDHPQVMLSTYDTLRSPIQQGADTLRSTVFKHTETALKDNISLEACHTAGVYASYGIGIFQTLRGSASIFRTAKSLPVVSENQLPCMFKSAVPQKGGYCPRDPITKEPLPLPRNKYGVDIPSSDTPHTQIGWKEGRKVSYRQTLEWGYNGKMIKRTDWTNHGRKDHVNPHEHPFSKNWTGGSMRQDDLHRPFKITDEKTICETR